MPKLARISFQPRSGYGSRLKLSIVYNKLWTAEVSRRNGIANVMFVALCESSHLAENVQIVSCFGSIQHNNARVSWNRN